MNYFMNLATRSKLLFSFGFICILLLSVIIFAYKGIHGITQSEKQLFERDVAIALELKEFRSLQILNRASMLDMMLTKVKSEQMSIAQSINENSKEINDRLSKLPALDQDPKFQSQLKDMTNYINEYRESRKEEIELVQSGKVEEAQKIGTTFQKDRFEKIRSLSFDMGNTALSRANEQLGVDLQKAKSSIILFVVLGSIAIFFSVIMIVMMNSTIAKPLNQLSSLASCIAKGDLSVAIISSERKDEVGVLNLAFSKMVENLRVTNKDIIEAVNSLGSSASEILAATTQVASGSAETAAAISETTTTVEEVRQAAQLSNQKASRVSENAQQVAMVTQTGHKAVDDIITTIHEIQKQMELVAITIVRLSEQSQQIGGIIASVTDVADQSNLLAVNAAIEAAKAGEQGKGFAVVAQEIKSLAQLSKQATIEVRNILNDVQKATGAAVMATELTSKAVENGVKQSSLVSEAIKNLSESSAKAVDAATQIVASSHQQVVGMDQIGLAMQNINQAGTENAASMVQAEKAAKNLAELGHKLKLLVNQYKI